MLTSTKNPTIQHIRELQTRPRARREAGQFVVEGVRLVEEALTAGMLPQTLLHTAQIGERGEKLLAGFRARGLEPIPVSDPVMQAASDTATPQGILAVLPIISRPLPAAPHFVLILDRVRDPGNLGTTLRTAAAAGVEALLLPPETADPYAPKVVRAGMGAHFRLPIVSTSWENICQIISPLHVFLADAAGKISHTEADFVPPLALIIGGETHGAGSETRGLHPTPIRIPMPGGTESLNAAVAAGIILFEIVRQRSPEKKV